MTNVCKCENLSLWGALDVVQSTEPFPYENGYIKLVHFDFNPKLSTKRFLVFCGNLLPVGEDDGTNPDVIVKCRRERPASDDYWTLYFNRMDIARNILAKFDDETDGKREERELDFADVSEAKFAGYSYWDEIVLSMKEYFHRKLVKGEHVVIEEYLPGKFEKFDDTVDEFIEAFQHYSYHYSEREFMLFGFEGVKFDDFYKVTVPFIHSVKQEFGPRDKGEEAIKEFFLNHRCSDLCRKWTTPKKIRRKSKISASMEAKSDTADVANITDVDNVVLVETGAKFNKSPYDADTDLKSRKGSVSNGTEECAKSKIDSNAGNVYFSPQRRKNQTKTNKDGMHTKNDSCENEENDRQPTVIETNNSEYKAIHPDPGEVKSTAEPSTNDKPMANGACVRDSDADTSKAKDEVFYIHDISLDLKDAAVKAGSQKLYMSNGLVGAKSGYLNNNDPKQEELNKSRRKLQTHELVIHCDYLGDSHFGANGFRSTAI